MNYSDLIVRATSIVASKIGCGEEAAAEMLDNVVFNTDLDLHSFFGKLLDKEIK